VHTGVKLIAALLAAAGVVLPALASPAAGDVGPETGNGGSNTGGRYGAWAWYQATGGGEGASRTSNDCELPAAPREPAHFEYFVTRSVTEPDTLFVSFVCVGELLRQAHPEPIPVLEGWEQDFLDVRWSGEVTRTPLDELVAHALLTLDPQPPAIQTDLYPEVDGLVNLPVQFSLAGGLGGLAPRVAAQDGPVRVTLSADPDPGVPVVWHAGDGRQACESDADPAVCTHVYARSSYGQHHEGILPNEYRVSADITYIGHYVVTLNGGVVADDDIGNIQRAAVLGLPVDEGQAINTPD
jgi:hypothetical protein